LVGARVINVADPAQFATITSFELDQDANCGASSLGCLMIMSHTPPENGADFVSNVMVRISGFGGVTKWGPTLTPTTASGAGGTILTFGNVDLSTYKYLEGASFIQEDKEVYGQVTSVSTSAGTMTVSYLDGTIIDPSDLQDIRFAASVETIDTMSEFANTVQRAVSAGHCRSLVEAGLESLPNSVVADVDVVDVNAGAFSEPYDSGSGEDIIVWKPSALPSKAQYQYSLGVNFISNSGDVAAMTFIGRDNQDDAIEDDFMHHADSYTEPEISIVETRKGTTENAVCSNRGTCDFETGLCKCFNGFTLENCSEQNVMAMY